MFQKTCSCIQVFLNIFQSIIQKAEAEGILLNIIISPGIKQQKHNTILTHSYFSGSKSPTTVL
jgi:hypothetical protein